MRAGRGRCTRVPSAYEVEVYCVGEEGVREPVSGIAEVDRDLSLDGPTRRVAFYLSVEEVKARYSRVVDHVARLRADGREYVAEIRWVAKVDASEPPFGSPTRDPETLAPKAGYEARSIVSTGRGAPYPPNTPPPRKTPPHSRVSLMGPG